MGEEFSQTEEHPFSQMALSRMKINTTVKPVSYCWKKLFLFMLFVCLFGFFLHVRCGPAPLFQPALGLFYISHWDLMPGFVLFPLPSWLFCWARSLCRFPAQLNGCQKRHRRIRRWEKPCL